MRPRAGTRVHGSPGPSTGAGYAASLCRAVRARIRVGDLAAASRRDRRYRRGLVATPARRESVREQQPGEQDGDDDDDELHR